MIMTEELPAETATKVFTRVTCSGIRTKGRFKGQRCGELLARVDLDLWEETMADTAELVCNRCGERYSLAKYIDSR